MIYKFVDINSLVIPRNCYSAYVDEHINSKHELFQFFNDTFHFPEWWGWNWDALDDVCRDFSWLRDEDIYILNKSLPILKEDDLRIYLGSISMYSNFWDDYPEHNFNVIFDNSIYSNVCALCEQYKIPLPSDDKKEK